MRDIAARIWASEPAREIVLLIVAAVATQFAFSAAELTNAIDEATSWRELWTSGTAWLLAFSFALVQTVIKQFIAYALSRAAGRRLAGADSANDRELRRVIADLPPARLEALGLRRITA